MKKINHLQAITVSFFTMIIIVSWSCSASRKQAVSCPEFPENRYKTVEHNSRTKRHETTFTYRQNRNQSKKKGSSIYSVKIKQGIQLPDSKETSDRLVYLTNDVLQSKQLISWFCQILNLFILQMIFQAIIKQNTGKNENVIPLLL